MKVANVCQRFPRLYGVRREMGRIVRLKPGLLAMTVLILGSSSSVHAQSTVGDWNLSSWVYSGFNISTSSVSSNGSTPVNLSATVNSSANFFVLGKTDGSVEVIRTFLAPPQAISTYQSTQTFQFSSPVDFGSPSNQSQFGDPLIDNGIGIQINSQSSVYITTYDLTISLIGGGIFSSAGSVLGGFKNPTGLGTNTIRFNWGVFPYDGMSSFDTLRITGGITGFSVMHDVTYDNVLNSSLNLTNAVEIKVNTSAFTAGLRGDFNEDEKVDAADYVLWRNRTGSNTALPNDNNLGTPIGANHYDLWREQFGAVESSIAATVTPEVGSIPLAVVALFLYPCWRKIGVRRRI